MRKSKIILVAILAMLAVSGCKENKKIEEVTTMNENEKKTETKKVVNEELIIKENGKEIYGKLYMPEEEGTYPAVILSHGYNGSHTDFTTECQYFASHGFIAYAYDFSGGSTRSKSSGETTDMSIFTEKEDLLTVLNYFKNMEKVDKERIYLFGGSQGGLVTTLATEESKESVRGMILYYPALNIPDDWRGNYATEEEIPETVDFWGLKLGKKFFVDMRDFYTFDNIGTFTGDILIIHGDKDAIVPLSISERAVDLYENAELVVLPGEGHGYSPAGAKTARELALEFMQKH
ncbi:MAG: alpha/beta fold hydrolase [Lachnospiraceae bacterium]|nr:alpha/beta fold hydrolase [Lachnospiraceae bacterium]